MMKDNPLLLISGKKSAGAVGAAGAVFSDTVDHV